MTHSDAQVGERGALRSVVDAFDGWLEGRTDLAPVMLAVAESRRAVDETERFPFTRPEGSDASMFIQWKGTDVCLDFTCPCGSSGHFDGYFAYFVHCPACGAVYELGTQVIARRCDHPASEAVTLSGSQDGGSDG